MEVRSRPRVLQYWAPSERYEPPATFFNDLMDPVSIATALASLLKLCWSIYEFIKDNKDVQGLDIQIKSLSEVLRSISNLLGGDKRPILQGSYEEEHWANVRVCLDDCAKVLEKLKKLVESGTREGFMVRLTYVLRSKASSAEIALLKQQLMSSRETLQLSLQAITMYSQNPRHPLTLGLAV